MVNKDINLDILINGIVKLVGGSVFISIFGILALPIITRLYSSEVFGVFMVFMSIAGMLSIFATLRYDLPIMFSESNEESASLIGVSFCALLLTVTLLFPLVPLVKSFMMPTSKYSELAKYLWLLLPLVFIRGIYIPLEIWSLRFRRFGIVTISQIVLSISSNAAKLIFGFLGYITVNSLILGSILGEAVSVCLLGSYIWKHDSKLLKKNILWNKIVAAMRNHRYFSFINSYSFLIRTISVQMPIWLLAIFFDPRLVGFYALSNMVFVLPGNLINKEISRVFLQQACELNNKGNGLSDMVGEFFKRVVVLSIFPFLLLLCIGKDFVLIIFGEPWIEAGVYVQILALSAFFSSIAFLLRNLFIVLKKHRFALVFNIVLFLITVLVLIVGGVIGDMRLTLILFSGVTVLFNLYLNLWLLSQAQVSTISVLTYIVKYSRLFLFLLGFVLLGKWIIKLSSLNVIISGFITTIIYYILVLRSDEVLRIGIRSFFRKYNFTK